jgi:flagellar hook-associated protein 3 FlgL
MATSFNRISSANGYDNALRNLSNRQSNLSTLQENLTTGKKIVRPSDDPTGAALAERAMNRISRIQADQRALESQRNSIVAAESTLGDVVDALQNFRELVVSAGNAVFGPTERRAIATQLSGLRDQVFALANRNDSNGLPLFGALGSALAPFVGPQATPPDYTFNGLPGQTASSDVSIPYALDGDSAFMNQTARDGIYNVTTSTIPTNRSLQTNAVTVSTPGAVTGLGYRLNITGVDSTTVPGTTTVTYDITEDPTGAASVIASASASYPSNLLGSIVVTGMPGLSLTLTGTPAVGDTVSIDPSASLFSVLDDAIANIGSAANGNAAAQAVRQALGNVDFGMSRVSSVRGQAGDLLNRADRISDNQDKRSIQLESDRSRAEDLDMTKGISDFQNQQTGYQAALQSYAQIQRISLFNYIT